VMSVQSWVAEEGVGGCLERATVLIEGGKPSTLIYGAVNIGCPRRSRKGSIRILDSRVRASLYMTLGVLA